MRRRRLGDLRQYRQLCYTDIVPLLATEQLAGGRLPFLDPCVPLEGQNCDEYPVLTMYFMRVADWISGDDYGAFFWVNAALLSACAVVTVAAYDLRGGSPRPVLRARAHPAGLRAS